MASCTFQLEFEGAADTLVKKIKKNVKKADGHYSGDSDSGEIEVSTGMGTVEGNYKISKSNIEIEITNKPALLTCSKIEGELKKIIKK